MRSLSFWVCFCLLFSFLSISGVSSQEQSSGYWITEEELTTLEGTLTRQMSTLKEQEGELKKLREQSQIAQRALSEATSSISQLSLTMKRLETSSSELESAVRRSRILNWVLAGTSAVLAVIVILQ